MALVSAYPAPKYPALVDALRSKATHETINRVFGAVVARGGACRTGVGRNMQTTARKNLPLLNQSKRVGNSECARYVGATSNAAMCPTFATLFGASTGFWCVFGGVFRARHQGS